MFSRTQRPWLNIFLFSTFSGWWLFSSQDFVFIVYFHISIFYVATAHYVGHALVIFWPGDTGACLILWGHIAIRRWGSVPSLHARRVLVSLGGR